MSYKSHVVYGDVLPLVNVIEHPEQQDSSDWSLSESIQMHFAT